MIENNTKENTVVLENVSKVFKIKHPIKKRPVFNNFNLKIKKGENLGIIGKNGSGKSVLLKLIAKIYQSNSGLIETLGSVLYLTGFNQGLKRRLTPIDNIYLIGALFGLNKKDIKKQVEQIVSFAELEEFKDQQLYTFSNGMISRLGFSIVFHLAMNSSPDIILLDEVFGAGGDIAFKNKAIHKVKELMNSGSTVIFVSHNLNLINNYCDRVIWIENGEIKETGKPGEVTKKYKNLYAKN